MIQQIGSVKNKFQVVWDIGRRCSYDCSYCAAHVHNTTSPFADFEKSKKMMEFVDDYISLYEMQRHEPYSERGIAFTGGEPTIHPSFFELLDYINEKYPNKYKLGLTTNGAFSRKTAEKLIDSIDSGTISYHCEAAPKVKKLVRDNILFFGENSLSKDKHGKFFKVNVMFHKDYFDECVELCEELDANGILYTPRRIGDQGNRQYSLNMGWAHEYTDEQEDWFDSYFNKANKGKYKAEKRATHKGRMCCGQFEMCVNKEDKVKFIPDTNFQDWACGVNWYFLYIHMEMEKIFLHQTCNVNLDSEVGPIGSFDDTEKILQELENNMVNNQMPVIRCPLDRCGCGVCADKAATPGLYNDLLKTRVREDLKYDHPDRTLPHQDYTERQNVHTILGYEYDFINGKTYLNGKEVKRKGLYTVDKRYDMNVEK